MNDASSVTKMQFNFSMAERIELPIWANDQAQGVFDTGRVTLADCYRAQTAKRHTEEQKQIVRTLIPTTSANGFV